MKTIRIRKFTVLCLFILLLFPWIFYVGAHFAETKSFNFDMNEAQQLDLEATRNLIEKNADKWTDPDWQHQFKRQLEQMNMEVSILTEGDQVILQTDDNREPSFSRKEQFSIVQDGQILGRVAIYQADSKTTQIVAIIIGGIVAFLIVAYAIRKYILIPLEKMGRSARQIAEGDLDIQLPSSRIFEIAEVHNGFRIMVDSLKKSVQNQIQLEDERRFVIAAVAHDLRTPLFALRGYLNGLKQGIAGTPEKQAKYLAVCIEKSAQLDRLVEELFTFAKTEYQEVGLNTTIVDLSLILKKSIDSLNPPALEKNITVIAEGLEKGCMVKGDSHLLERAINNLIDNAVRHTPTNGHIIIKCKKDEELVTFSIQDTGRGFSSEDLPKVFESLYRGDASRNRSTGGAGLGLTISQRVIRQHGGELVAGNASEGGAMITGQIPLAKTGN
ncbi:HAMP domain-containing histidine kinase [Ureibacillus chungkukjangi]|uniref:sensor histidine kinase n=1 Tax=Ureibacillus chungkukjangi TaxID=1202712 RepID=UPI002041E3A4|nr:HAMP domain-containing sensor histidine kinase [Ureibacillus chungkukjangi]MCM3389220.1 HAMP domain-containing histidine kinase [Ureibacillus chungkukjangi]